MERASHIALGLVLLLGLAACQVETRNGTTAADTTAVAASDAEAYRTNVAVRTSAVDERIQALQGRLAQMDSTAQDEYRDELDHIREDRRKIEERLDEARSKTRAEWADFRRDVDEDLQDLEQRADRLEIDMAQNREELGTATRNQMRRLEERIDRLQGEASEQSREALDKLREQRDELARDLDDLGDSTAENLEEAKERVKSGFNRVWDRIKDVDVRRDDGVEATNPRN